MKKIIMMILLPFFVFAQGNEVIHLNLEKSIELALTNNHQLNQIKYDFKIAKEQADETFGNSVLPSINANVNYQRAIKQSEFYIETPFFSGFFKQGKQNTLVGSVNLQQPLFTSAMFLAVQIAELFAQMSEENYFYSRSELVANTKEIYYNVILAKEMLKVANESLKLAEENMNSAEIMHENGLISDYDLLKAKVQYQTTLPYVSDMENNVVLAENGLKIIAGLELSQKISVEDKIVFSVFDKININDAIADLHENNKAINQLKITTELYENRKALEFSKHFPELSLSGNYQTLAQEDDNISFNNWTYINSSSVSLNLSIPLFKGLSTIARTEQAELEVKKSKENFLLVKKNLENQVYSLVNSMDKNLKNIESLKLAKDQSSEGLQIAQKRFAAGLGSQLEVIDAQLTYADTKLKYLSAIRDYNVQKAKLDHLINNN